MMHVTGYSKTRAEAARAGANSASQGSKEAKPELEAPRKPPQPQPDPQDQPTEAKAKSEKSEMSLRAEVEVSIISARGAILMEKKDDSWKLGEDTNQYHLKSNCEKIQGSLLSLLWQCAPFVCWARTCCHSRLTPFYRSRLKAC